MLEFNYANKISFKISDFDKKNIHKLVSPANFTTAYREITDIIEERKKEEQQLNQNKDKKHFKNLENELNQALIATNNIIKKQTAMALLYQKLNDATFFNEAFIINLNMMLAFELYAVISNFQDRLNREINDIENNQNKDFINKTTEEKNNYIIHHQNLIKHNKDLIKVIFKNFTFADIHKVSINYNSLTPLQHLDYCLINY